jgi:hypothetical protein
MTKIAEHVSTQVGEFSQTLTASRDRAVDEARRSEGVVQQWTVAMSGSLHSLREVFKEHAILRAKSSPTIDAQASDQPVVEAILDEQVSGGES